MSVRLYPINVKTAEPIGPNFVWGLKPPHETEARTFLTFVWSVVSHEHLISIYPIWALNLDISNLGTFEDDPSNITIPALAGFGH